MKDKLTAQQRKIVANNNGLSRYLLSLERGRDFTPRSGLYENQPADKVLSDGLNILNSLKNGDSFSKLVYQFDTSQLEKWGPQGGVEPIAKLRESFNESFKAASPLPARNSSEWCQAKEWVQKELVSIFGKERLRPASYASVIDDMRARDTLSSNSGGPLFAKRTKPEVVEASIADAKSGKGRDYPAIILFRNYNKKTREVGMYPMSTNIVEGTFIQPLQNKLRSKNLEFFSPGESFKAVKESITRTFDKGDYIAASDFSQTDQHFTSATTLEVYDVLKVVFQRQYGEELRFSMLHINNISLVTGKNEIYHGAHGVSSGSGGTNFIETIFDGIFSKFVWLKTRTHDGLYAIGDDMSGRSRVYDSQFSAKLSKLGAELQQVIKVEKTHNEPNWVVSLQRLFQRGYRESHGDLIRGVYSTIRALKSAVYPEKFHNPKLGSSDMFCARVYMILENCVDHPLFEDFVKFVVKGQRDLIPFSRYSSRKLEEITKETKLLPSFNPSYNQEKRDLGLQNFASIRLARNL